MPPRTRSQSAARKANNTCVFLWIPNLIGYFRVVLAIVAFYYAFKNATLFILCYSVSALLDLFDGMAARHFHQSSKFGAVLDMVTDRVGTNVLILILAAMYPKRYFELAMMAALDYSSHWVRMYAAATIGEHHKEMSNETTNWLLRKYYTVRPLMFACCLFQETFLIGAYGFYHATGQWVAIFKYVMMVSAPIGGLKQLINLIQLVDASKKVAHLDNPNKSK